MLSYLTLLPLYESSPGAYCYILLILLYITVSEAFAIFIDADIRIKGVQIGDPETKQQFS